MPLYYTFILYYRESCLLLLLTLNRARNIGPFFILALILYYTAISTFISIRNQIGRYSRRIYSLSFDALYTILLLYTIYTRHQHNKAKGLGQLYTILYATGALYSIKQKSGGILGILLYTILLWCLLYIYIYYSLYYRHHQQQGINLYTGSIGRLQLSGAQTLYYTTKTKPAHNPSSLYLLSLMLYIYIYWCFILYYNHTSLQQGARIIRPFCILGTQTLYISRQ